MKAVGRTRPLWVFCILVFLASATCVQGEEENLIDIEENQNGEPLLVAERRLEEEEKRIESIKLRKKIISEIYNRGSNMKQTNTDRQGINEKSVNDTKGLEHKVVPNPKRRRRPFLNEPKTRFVDQGSQSGATKSGKQGEKGPEIEQSVFLKEADEFTVEDEVVSAKILSHQNQPNLIVTRLKDPRSSDFVSPNDLILETMASGRETLRKQLLRRRRPFQESQRLDGSKSQEGQKQKQKDQEQEGQSQGNGKEIASETRSQSLEKDENVPGSSKQSSISSLDQDLSESTTWEQNFFSGSWPAAKLEGGSVGGGEVGEGEEETLGLGLGLAGQGGPLGLRLTTAAPLLGKEELLIKVLSLFLKSISYR